MGYPDGHWRGGHSSRGNRGNRGGGGRPRGTSQHHQTSWNVNADVFRPQSMQSTPLAQGTSSLHSTQPSSTQSQPQMNFESHVTPFNATLVYGQQEETVIDYRDTMTMRGIIAPNSATTAFEGNRSTHHTSRTDERRSGRRTVQYQERHIHVSHEQKRVISPVNQRPQQPMAQQQEMVAQTDIIAAQLGNLSISSQSQHPSQQPPRPDDPKRKSRRQSRPGKRERAQMRSGASEEASSAAPTAAQTPQTYSSGQPRRGSKPLNKSELPPTQTPTKNEGKDTRDQRGRRKSRSRTTREDVTASSTTTSSSIQILSRTVTSETRVKESHDREEKGRGRRSRSRRSKVSADVEDERGNGYAPGGRQSGNGKETRPSRNRRALYDEYLPMSQVSLGLDRGTLMKGQLRINKKNRSMAFVTVEGKEEDIYVPGTKYRNRALDGDTVIISLLSPDEHQFEITRLLEQRQERKELQQSKLQKISLRDENGDALLSGSDDEGENEEEEEDVNREMGKVVFIWERREQFRYSGTLHMDLYGKESDGGNGGNRNRNTNGNGNGNGNGNNAGDGNGRKLWTPGNAEEYQGKSNSRPLRIIWFKPVDKRVPLIAIPVEDAPKDFLSSPSSFSTTLFAAMIKRWPTSSKHPFGTITGALGQIGELAVATEALLADHGVEVNEFSDEVMSSLPDVPWTIPQIEKERRRDFTQTRIMSIDPQTAKDLDDAVSVVELGDGTYEVGVHIADVSYFVQPRTALDAEANRRATTVYLVQKAIPMLPRLLCEELCSLNPGVERLAFSVVWRLDAEGNSLDKPWFGRSIIKSCAKMSYDHAQAIIEGRDWSLLPTCDIHCGYTVEDVKKDVLILYKMSRAMRQRRFDSGALSMNNIKLWFALDEDGNPMSTGVYEQKEANRLIEEFMLFANMAVATYLAEQFPETALLRRHSPPNKRLMQEFVARATKMGYEMDCTSSKSLQVSFDKITDEEKKFVLRLLCIKPMQRAQYFCTGLADITAYSHYALNVPLYTHFTSPIRRYCDVIVHRLLDAALQKDASITKEYDKTRVGEIAKHCNNRKDNAKNAQDASSKVYLCVYLDRVRSHLNIKDLVVDGIVFDTQSRSFDVVVEKFGIEKRIWIEDLIDENAIVGSEWSDVNKTITLYWKKDAKKPDAKQAVNGSKGDDTEQENAMKLAQKIAPSDVKEIMDRVETDDQILAQVNRVREFQDETRMEKEIEDVELAPLKNGASDSEDKDSEQDENKKTRRSKRLTMALKTGEFSEKDISVQRIQIFQRVKVRIQLQMDRLDLKLMGCAPWEPLTVFPKTLNRSEKAVESELDAYVMSQVDKEGLKYSCPGAVDEAD